MNIVAGPLTGDLVDRASNGNQSPAGSETITPVISGVPCQHCGTAFEPRKGNGGKPQKFCSAECRKAFHTGEKPNVSQLGQRAALEKPAPARAGGPSKAHQQQAALVAAGDGDWVWTIPHQLAIDCAPLADGSVEISQEGQRGPAIINVAAGNTVRLARSILYAAGFPNVLIATHIKGGYTDVEDGQLAIRIGAETSQ